MALINDIKPTGTDSAYVTAPFDLGKKELEEGNYQLISAEQNAGLRVQHGKDAFVSKNGNFVKEGCVYVPNKGRFLTRGSIVVAMPTEATQAHREGKEFYVTNEQVDSVLGNSVQVPYDQSSVPTDRFGEDPVTVFLFGQIAKKYGDFLKDAKIKKMPLYFNDQKYVDEQKQPFANQLWLARLDNYSDVDGFNGGLGFNDAVRGVKFSAEGDAKKLDRTYSLNEIIGVLKAGNLGGLESTVTNLFKANN
jgi:hypothetical protein